MNAYPNLVTQQPSPSKNRAWIYIAIALVVGALLFYYFVLRGGGTKTCTDYTTEADCKSPCYWNTTTKLCSNVTPTPPAPPTELPSLMGHYVASSYNVGMREWVDKSTKGNHIKDVVGTVNLSTDLKYIYGGTDVKFTLPSAVFDRDYTLITVAKYNGEAKKRIFTSSEGDWYSGHNDGKSGVAKHDTLITDDIDRHGSDWVLSVDQRNSYRANGRKLTGSFLVEGFPSNIGVNIKEGQESDFAIAEIMIFNEEIQNDMIAKYESELMKKYNIAPSRFKIGKVKNGPHTDAFDSVKLDCGWNSGLMGFKQVNDGTNWWYEYSCMFDLDKVGQSSTTLQTATKARTVNVYDTFLNENIVCNEKPLRGYSVGKVNDKANVSYECSNARVTQSTCRNAETSTNVHFNEHEVMCNQDEVMTQFNVVKLADDTTKYTYKCCRPEGY